MHLTDRTDYVLRVLMYLNQEKRLVTLNELSSRLSVSRNNLIKISNQLARLNFIETVRGRAGGLLIKAETGKASLKEIILATEESFFLAECFSGRACDCAFLKGCLLKKGLAEALEAFLNALAQKTLNDVTPHGGMTTP